MKYNLTSLLPNLLWLLINLPIHVIIYFLWLIVSFFRNRRMECFFFHLHFGAFCKPLWFMFPHSIHEALQTIKSITSTRNFLPDVGLLWLVESTWKESRLIWYNLTFLWERSWDLSLKLVKEKITNSMRK